MRTIYRNLTLLLAFGVALCYSGNSTAQIQHEGRPAKTQYNLTLDNVPSIELSLSAEKQQESKQRTDLDSPGVPLHAGYSIEAGINAKSQGYWEVVDQKLHVWRIHLVAPGALGVGLNFDAFELGEDSRLFVYDPDNNFVLGAFDKRNNNEHQVFTTSIIPGQEIIVEYQEPYYPGKSQVMPGSMINIESLIYITFSADLLITEKDLGSSDYCQVNINCEEGDDWQDEKRGVARMLMRTGSDYSWCTGSLINNTAQDMTPYFLSAEHCGRNSSDHDMLFWQFYFNFERPGCVDEGTPLYNVLVGCEKVSQGPLLGGSDFRLVELNSMPPAQWRPYWNGWDRSTNISNAGVGIHHPAGDAKKIATYNLALVSSNPLVSGQQMATNSAWQVRWSPTDNGHSVSQGGSSGSPLFNSQGLVIGTLTGGSSNCDSPHNPDYYGKFSYHWNQNGVQPGHTLVSHLDPMETGQLTLEGLDPFNVEFPSPGSLQAEVNQANQVTIQWFEPGSFPNPQGWYSYAQASTHLSWATPERATIFQAENFGLSYPLTLSSVSHVFVEHSTQPWPDDKFTFKIYDHTGITLIYESPVLTAVSQEQYIHELPQAIEFNSHFYVAVDPVHSSGHPSSLMRSVNYGEGFSFNGTSGNWVPYNVRPATGPWTAYAYLTGIYVENQQGKSFDINNLSKATLNALPQEYTIDDSEIVTLNLKQDPNTYRLYRDNVLIHTSSSMTFQETINEPGLYKYHVTAVYGGDESLPSGSAYVLIAPSCAQVIDQWPYNETFATGFDDQCWITTNSQQSQWNLSSGFTWEQNTIDPVSGDQFYIINPSLDVVPDSWLITPQMDFSQLQDPALQFAFNGIFPHGQIDILNYIAVMVSVDGGSFQRVFDSRNHASFTAANPGLEWHQASVNLSKFANESDVRVAFQFVGLGSAFAAIDDIRVRSAEEMLYTLSINVTPSYFGTVTGAGQYLQGETVTVVANPNVAKLFDAWEQSGNVVSQQLVYQFLMPANNTTITARFMGDPTNIDELENNGLDLMTAFPNPTQNNITLRFNEQLGNVSITLFNVQGQIVEQFQVQDALKGDQQKITMQHLPKGMYFISLGADKQNQVIKVILN